MTSIYPEQADPNRAAGRPLVQNCVNGLVPIPDREASPTGAKLCRFQNPSNGASCGPGNYPAHRVTLVRDLVVYVPME